MSDKEYLEARGWIYRPREDEWTWPAYAVTEGLLTFSTPIAVTVQRSRDALEERRVWSEQAAALAGITRPDDVAALGGGVCDIVASYADHMMDRYRARFSQPSTSPERTGQPMPSGTLGAP